MLADNPIEPSFDAAGQAEILAVDRERQTISQNAFVKPVGDGQLNTGRAPLLVGWRGVSLDPVKPLRLLPLALANVGANQRAAKPLESFDNPLVLVSARSAVDAPQEFIERHLEGR